MAHFRLPLVLVFSIFFACLFISTQARIHNHAKHNRNHHRHGTSHISEPPSVSSNGSNSAASPPSSTQADTPSEGENAHNSHFSPSPPPQPSPQPPTNHGIGNNSNISSPLPSPQPASPPNNNDDDNDKDSYNSPRVTIFDVRKFGATGDGVTDDTDAFKMAWDTACQQSNSSIIRVGYGFTFMIQPTVFTGPCQGDIVFQVDGTVMPPDGPESWPEKNSKRQWLVFYKVNGLSVQGAGTINGRGQNWWNLPCKPHRGPNGSTLPGPCDSPISIRFFLSSNLALKGIRIKDSPQFNFRFDQCKNVHIESIYITAPALSPNTDGIHIENTNNVGIYNSVVSNGDDCVSIGSGCYDVDIRNITCGPSHGISIGSLGNHNSRACVHNITVRDSVIKMSDNGVRIKSWQGGSGAVSGVTYSNIHMINVRNPIIIDQFYCLSKNCTNQTSAVYISNIQYANIKGTYDIRSPPMHFACSDAVPCTNLTLSNVELLPAQGDLVSDPYCWNAYGSLQMLTIPPVSCLMDGIPRSLLNSELERC